VKQVPLLLTEIDRAAGSLWKRPHEIQTDYRNRGPREAYAVYSLICDNRV
jgi:hypothetical protein